MNERSLTQTKSSFTPVQTGVLQRKCTFCGQHTIAGGECTSCAKKKGSLQRKLTIGASNDPLELEADRVADQVMAASAYPAVSVAPPRIQRFTGQPTGQTDMAAPASVDHVLSSPGRLLEPSLQQDMEQRFGHDFSRVRVHTDAAAERSARDVNANAYTVGQNIVFGASRFAPENREGKALLAHELTHVVQQRNAPIDLSAVEPQGSAAEREADATASDVTAGRAAKQPSAVPRGIPRDVGWASQGEIPDPYGMGYNTIYKNAGPDSKGAVLVLASLETPRMFVDIDKYKKLEAPMRKSILALEPHAAETACSGWFDLLRANDPDFNPTLTLEQTRAGEAAYYASSREVVLDKKVESAKAELPTLDPVAIDAKWKDNKYGLITAAQTPNYGIKAETFYRIWIKYWSDKHKYAEHLRQAIAKREFEANFVKYLRKLNEYEMGDRTAMGPGYAKALADIALGDLMFRYSTYAMEICRAANAQGKSLTLDELTQRVISFAEPRERLVQGLEMGLTLGRGRGAEPVKTEPAKTQSVTPSRPVAGFARPLASPTPTPKPTTPSRPVAGFARPIQEPAPQPVTPSRPVAGFARPLAPPTPTPTTPSRPVAGFARPIQEPAPQPVTPSRPVAGFARPLAPPTPTPTTPSRGTISQSPRPVLVSPDPQARTGAPTKMSGEEPPTSSKPSVGKVEPVKPEPIDRIGQVKEWAKRNKITGDIEGLKSGLRSKDPATRTAAEKEFDEAAAKIRNGEKHYVEDFENARPKQAEPPKSKISTAEKSELENSAWLKKRVKSEGDRRKFMKWLKKGHKEGDLGAELKPGDRDVGKHEHLRPGSPEAEAKVSQWEAEGKP